MKKVQQSDVLAEGEVTGHAHRLNGPGQILMDDETGDRQVVGATEESFLSHEEHNKLGVIPTDKTEVHDVIGVKEIDPLSQAVRRVAD